MEGIIKFFEDKGPLLTAVLAIAAIAAAIIAWYQLRELDKQGKRDTFLPLLKELGERKARANRRIIFQLFDMDWNSKEFKENIEAIIQYAKDSKEYYKSHGDNSESKKYIDAIEETITCLDRLAYFLIKGGCRLRKEAPDWIWTITSQMWNRTYWYVDCRENRHPHYIKYFRMLDKEAKKKYEEPSAKDISECISKIISEFENKELTNASS